MIADRSAPKLGLSTKLFYGFGSVGYGVKDVAFRSFLLTFLDGAEVLEPAWFRAEMVAWLEALA